MSKTTKIAGLLTGGPLMSTKDYYFLFMWAPELSAPRERRHEGGEDGVFCFWVSQMFYSQRVAELDLTLTA